MTNKLMDKALHLAWLGFDVFPVAPGTKVPLTEHGWKDASGSQGQIEQWWQQHPDALVGVPTGPNNIVVMDIDVKKGKDGYAALKAAGRDLTDTFNYATPSGGRHYVYLSTDSKRFGQSTNLDSMEGVDRQSGASYVVWYGDVPWEPELKAPPGWVTTHYRSESATTYGDQTPYSGTWAEWEAKLKGHGPRSYATEAFLFDLLKVHHVGNEEVKAFTYRLAFLVAEEHSNTQKAHDELKGKYWTTSNEPDSRKEAEWDRLLRGAIADAEEAKRRGELVMFTPQPGDWEPPADVAEPAPEELKVYSRSDLKNLPKPSWIVPGLLKESSLAMLAGAGGLGKTYLALYLAGLVATGKHHVTPFGAMVGEPEKVLYVGAEGIEDFDSRMTALETYYKLPTALTEENMQFVEEGVNFSDSASMDRLSRLVKDNQYKLIVLDTFSQLAHISNENDASQVADVMRLAKRLRTLSPGSCILFLHHASKESGRYRGSSALRDNIDTLISIYGKSSGFTLSTDSANAGKQRSGAPLTMDGWEIVTQGDNCVAAVTGAKTLSVKDDNWGTVRTLLEDGTARTTKEIAESTGLPYETTKKLLQPLKRDGALTVARKDGNTEYLTLTPIPGGDQ